MIITSSHLIGLLHILGDDIALLHLVVDTVGDDILLTGHLSGSQSP